MIIYLPSVRKKARTKHNANQEGIIKIVNQILLYSPILDFFLQIPQIIIAKINRESNNPKSSL